MCAEEWSGLVGKMRFPPKLTKTQVGGKVCLPNFQYKLPSQYSFCVALPAIRGLRVAQERRVKAFHRLLAVLPHLCKELCCGTAGKHVFFSGKG